MLYAFVDKNHTFISTKPPYLTLDFLWMNSFYLHIIFGGIALFIGWLQFLSKLRIRKPVLHKTIGKIYVFSVFISSLSAIYLGFFANEGIVASIGFILLGIIWFTTTLKALLSIQKKKISDHQKWMIFSYAACFSAVTLRVYLPLLTVWFEAETAYKIVAWLCWVPNIILAFLISRSLK